MSTPAREQKETIRVEAFSDGVFAIAITLLVLDLKLPHGVSSLSTELFRQWPTFAAFLNSFATILIIWINHHNTFWVPHSTDSRSSSGL